MNDRRDDVLRAAGVLDRRAFLRAVGVVAGAGLLPAGCGGVPDALRPRPGTTLRVLTPRTYATLTAAAMRIVGADGAALMARGAVDVGAAADAFLAQTPVVAGALQQALHVLEFGVPPLVRKLRPFTGLDGAAQDVVLDDLMTAGLDLKRQLFGGIRSFALLAFSGHGESHALCAYPGPFGDDRTTVGDAMTTEADWA